MGFSDVIIEGDSRIVIQKLQNHGNDKSVVGGVINKIIAGKDNFTIMAKGRRVQKMEIKTKPQKPKNKEPLKRKHKIL